MRDALACLASIVAPPFCWACGADAGRTQGLCPCCRRELRGLGGEPVHLGGVQLWSAVAYEGPARALVRGLKYRGASGLADPLAAAIAATAPRSLLAGDAVLVPVPMPAGRRRRRGYNQAERLATALARRMGLEVCDCLVRAPAARQVGRDRGQRLAGAGHGIGARVRSPARAVLVDDVATTGATLAACAAVLRRSGAVWVAAVTYARTPGR